ncbi:beta-ketoacyl-[acyl-carrier-protein] synthase family protein [Calycomorphotria hydatis]|uniref:3-oxoacyl-[acyl-carrier-protein] synthase 2 n=1 Tax=Calycomorphotria hydatis TaxID=2528027 RepID=A0A517T8U4_9PLAN|nr:beta-ketoacyl-[acyl-carrier-protein] synthase family protein [Calycomorphotria hydatis]QDT64787.1 3-oxoacyl-[acyl-carrier-protein] synthase 2 [Calycomorphotria hydatis]
MQDSLADRHRIVITGIGLTSPNGNNIQEFRDNLLAGRSGVSAFETRYMPPVLAGVCDFDPLTYQKRKEVRRGTRAGSIATYCAHEAIQNSGLTWENVSKDRVGVYIGITEHGNVETENEIFEISQFDYDTKVWSHHHNPRTVANNPAGEVTLSLGITGPHLTIGAACAAGNAGFIQGMQMLMLDEVDLAIAGGVSESIHTFGIFASFHAQGALAHNNQPEKACRPFDVDRNGIVVAEGGGLVTLERLPDALARGATIYGEIVGHAINSDASDFVLPNNTRQAECIRLALKRANLQPNDIDIVSSHATATDQGDIEESKALSAVFSECPDIAINNTKSFIGHAMGAAGALELLGNMPAFDDLTAHATINLDRPDPRCELHGIVANKPRKLQKVDHILNNSFGMLGINSTLIVRHPRFATIGDREPQEHAE